MPRLRHNILSGFLMLLSFMTYGQGLVQCGGHIVFENGGYLVVDGSGHYYDTLNGKVDIYGNGDLLIPGDWTNVSTSGVFTTNAGKVTLTGGVQQIKGGDMTLFPTLELSGTADKTLDVSALVGGGFSTGGAGQLNCNNRNLILNTQTLVVNNKTPSGIVQTGGGIVSETPNSIGYGTVEWVVRETGGSFEIPFRSLTGVGIPYQFTIQTAGVNAIDSGFVSVATYPTGVVASPNNRELPGGVLNTFNEYGVENAHRLIDRYWLVGTPNYSTKPFGVSRYGYQDAEWNTSNTSSNDILENNLRPMRYAMSSNTWLYSRAGQDNAISNYAEGVANDFEGIWTLSDSTICPVARFIHVGNCEQSPISFNDLSTISTGTIDAWDWEFGDGNTSLLQNSVNVYSAPNVYNVLLKVQGNTGCLDSVRVPVTIDTKAIADFMYDDDPLVDIPVQFTSLSQNTTSWDWDFGDFNSDNVENPKHTYGAESSYLVTLIANNIANCPDTVTKSIDVNLPSLFLLPSAFSPGTLDNINPTFGLSTLQRVSEFSMTIYNRWGEKIFESDDISKRWDGTYQNKPVPAGSYFYIVWFRDRTMQGRAINGSILLVR